MLLDEPLLQDLLSGRVIGIVGILSGGWGGRLTIFNLQTPEHDARFDNQGNSRQNTEEDSGKDPEIAHHSSGERPCGSNILFSRERMCACPTTTSRGKPGTVRVHFP